MEEEYLKHAHVTINLDYQTSSTRIIMEAVTKAYDETVDKKPTYKKNKYNGK